MAAAKDVVSADKVLVTTFCIFLLLQVMGLIGHCLLVDISLWVPTMINPACESGFLLEANEASENAINRKSNGGMGLMVKVTS